MTQESFVQPAINLQKLFGVLFEPLGDEIEFFIGGSRRFGYFHDTSDIDVFVGVPKVFVESPSFLDFLVDGEKSGINSLLKFLGLDRSTIHERKGKYHPESSCFKIVIFGFSVDLIVFEGEREAFHELRNEHILVESYLRQHPVLIEAYRDLPVRGALKYRKLLSMAMEQQKTKGPT